MGLAGAGAELHGGPGGPRTTGWCIPGP